MTTTELVFNGIIILLGLVLVVVAIRNPRTVFLHVPLLIITFPFRVIANEFGFDFFDDLFKDGRRKDTNKYKTIRRKYLTFAKCDKFLVTIGADEGMVRLSITKALASVNRQLKIEQFSFFNASVQTITLPPADISFRDFHYLIQFLTHETVTVGLVENKTLAYTVYSDDERTGLVGETDRGENFFVSLRDDFDKRQFIRVSNQVKPIEEYNISRIKHALVKVPMRDRAGAA